MDAEVGGSVQPWFSRSGFSRTGFAMVSASKAETGCPSRNSGQKACPTNRIQEARMRHAILGAGGVGGMIGVALAKSGESVTLVLRPETLKNYPAELSLESTLGSFSVPVERTATVAEPYDVLWITVKHTQLEAALRSVTVSADQI